jgi:hypothetical protein
VTGKDNNPHRATPAPRAAGGGTKLVALPGGGQPETKTQRAARERHERFLAKQVAEARKAEEAAQARETLERRARETRAGKIAIELRNDPDAIRKIARILGQGDLPDTYVRAGIVVAVETPSGAIATDDAPPQMIVAVDTKRLSRILADHTYTYEVKTKRLPDGGSIPIEVEAMPKRDVLAGALADSEWPKLRPLTGIVTAPVFRPDGTLVQTPGYDETTALIYSPKLPLPPVPEHPSDDELRAARGFLRDQLLADFPWVGASRANYIGLLIAPLLRSYLGGALVPLGVIDATSPATGKSLLAHIMTSIYSGHTRPWVTDDAELRKAALAILIDQGGAVVCLDNVGKGDVVDQPFLAYLLTVPVVSDRILGVTTNAKVPNDRVWLVTGNAITLGGDIPSRAVLVRLDANMPNPDLRPASKFALGDLERWLTDPVHRATVLLHLLVLVRGWIVAGAPQIETPMRSFTPWASATAGFLHWLAEPGFMSNRLDLIEVDDEESTYGAFYARWHDLFGDREVTTAELRDSAFPDGSGLLRYDWRGTFLVRKRDGVVPSASGLGKMLAAERGRFRGGFRLNGIFDGHAKTWTYSVTPSEESRW